MAFLELRDIHKSYYLDKEEFPVLKGISLDFDRGEFVSILGESGGGKSTLMNIIGGLDRNFTGKVLVNGQLLDHHDQKQLDKYRRSTVGYIYQSYNLISHLTVLDNVLIALDMTTMSREEQRQRALKLLERVGLGDQVNKHPNHLSGGQKQRVAIARALANDPSVLLCDEATSALDPQTTKSILRLLKHLNETLGITVVIITHEMAVVKEMRGERDEETWKRELRENMEKAYAEAYRLGGVASGEHGIGTAKRHYFLRETPQENLTTMNRLKDALDPLHILNDQKAYIETKRRG